ncbi:MAG: crosslink repair DNA glycosylase YcaQ family protein, partial [Vicinamibacterales bacterium]
RAKIPADGLKLAYLMMHAELEGVICSGPRKGKQFTYALLEERAPKAKARDRAAALAELTQRYFASHGPASIRDFAWWSGLTISEAQQAVDSVRTLLESSSIDNLVLWSARAADDAPSTSGAAFLLPNHDEYLIAYKDRAPVVDAARAANVVARSNGGFANHLLIDGRLAGSWSRSCNVSNVMIEVAPYKRLTAAQLRAVGNVADCYGEFLGLRASVSIV